MSTVTDLSRPRALSRTAFADALVGAGDEYSLFDTRLFSFFARESCPRSVLLTYARSIHELAPRFCATLSLLIEAAPDAEARLVLLHNLMEEEGIHLSPDKGLIVRPDRRHPALALRLVLACGGSAEDAPARDADTLGPARGMLAEGRWTEAVAFLLVGQELKFGRASDWLFEQYRRHGIAERDLAFFAVHGVADCRHGQEAIDLLLDRVHDRDEQERCIAAARAGAKHWFEKMGGAARASA
jgi:pyrroloquinoline quinone (PQQ) biosynthesis protein C